MIFGALDVGDDAVLGRRERHVLDIVVLAAGIAEGADTALGAEAIALRLVDLVALVPEVFAALSRRRRGGRKQRQGDAEGEGGEEKLRHDDLLRCERYVVAPCGHDKSFRSLPWQDHDLVASGHDRSAGKAVN